MFISPFWQIQRLIRTNSNTIIQCWMAIFCFCCPTTLQDSCLPTSSRYFCLLIFPQTTLLLSTIGFWTLFRPSSELPFFSIMLFFAQRHSKTRAYRRPSIFDYCSLDNNPLSFLQMYLSVNLWKNSINYIYGSLLKHNITYVA